MKPKKGKYNPSMKIENVDKIPLSNEGIVGDRVNIDKYRLKIPIHQPKKKRK